MSVQIPKIASEQKFCSHVISPMQTAPIVSHEVVLPGSSIVSLPRLFNCICYLIQGSMMLERAEGKQIKIMKSSKGLKLLFLIHLSLTKEYPSKLCTYIRFRLMHILSSFSFFLSQALQKLEIMNNFKPKSIPTGFTWATRMQTGTSR